MTISLKHAFQSAKADGGDASLVRPSNWNAEHTLTMATARLVGRSTAGTGAAEEISLGTGLSFSGTTLNYTMTLASVTAALGYKPVHQGGGTGQGANEVYIGWLSGSRLGMQIDGSNFGDKWPIDVSGAATHIFDNANTAGTRMKFQWSGQAGSPAWVWGGGDGVTHQVYSPAQFNVNYANSAANADTVDGYHATDLAQVYKGSDANLTNFPIGTMLLCYTGAAVNRNSTQAVYVSTGGATIAYDLRVLGGAYVQLAGSWANRGCHGNYALMQRIA